MQPKASFSDPLLHILSKGMLIQENPGLSVYIKKQLQTSFYHAPGWPLNSQGNAWDFTSQKPSQECESITHKTQHKLWILTIRLIYGQHELQRMNGLIIRDHLSSNLKAGLLGWLTPTLNEVSFLTWRRDFPLPESPMFLASGQRLTGLNNILHACYPRAIFNQSSHNPSSIHSTIELIVCIDSFQLVLNGTVLFPSYIMSIMRVEDTFISFSIQTDKCSAEHLTQWVKHLCISQQVTLECNISIHGPFIALQLLL